MKNKQIKVRVEVVKGSIDRALSAYKRKLIRSELLQEIRDRRYYTKPTTVRRKQKMDAIRNNKLNIKEDE